MSYAAYGSNHGTAMGYGRQTVDWDVIEFRLEESQQLSGEVDGVAREDKLPEKTAATTTGKKRARGGTKADLKDVDAYSTPVQKRGRRAADESADREVAVEIERPESVNAPIILRGAEASAFLEAFADKKPKRPLLHTRTLLPSASGIVLPFATDATDNFLSLLKPQVRTESGSSVTAQEVVTKPAVRSAETSVSGFQPSVAPSPPHLSPLSAVALRTSMLEPAVRSTTSAAHASTTSRATSLGDIVSPKRMTPALSSPLPASPRPPSVHSSADRFSPLRTDSIIAREHAVALQAKVKRPAASPPRPSAPPLPSHRNTRAQQLDNSKPAALPEDKFKMIREASLASGKAAGISQLNVHSLSHHTTSKQTRSQSATRPSNASKKAARLPDWAAALDTAPTKLVAAESVRSNVLKPQPATKSMLPLSSALTRKSHDGAAGSKPVVVSQPDEGEHAEEYPEAAPVPAEFAGLPSDLQALLTGQPAPAPRASLGANDKASTGGGSNLKQLRNMSLLHETLHPIASAPAEGKAHAAKGMVNAAELPTVAHLQKLRRQSTRDFALARHFKDAAEIEPEAPRPAAKRARKDDFEEFQTSKVGLLKASSSRPASALGVDPRSGKSFLECRVVAILPPPAGHHRSNSLTASPGRQHTHSSASVPLAVSAGGSECRFALTETCSPHHTLLQCSAGTYHPVPDTAPLRLAEPLSTVTIVLSKSSLSAIVGLEAGDGLRLYEPLHISESDGHTTVLSLGLLEVMQ